MSGNLLLISGAVAAGKSSVADLLIAGYGFKRVSSGDYLRRVAACRGLGNDRASLQSLGDQLDLDTDFAWLIDDVAVPAIAKDAGGRWLIDAVRKRRQVQLFRRCFEQVTHVHFSAAENVLKRRYIDRILSRGSNEAAAGAEYEAATLHENEIEARSLSQIATMVFDTGIMSPEKIAATIGGALEKGTIG